MAAAERGLCWMPACGKTGLALSATLRKGWRALAAGLRRGRRCVQDGAWCRIAELDRQRQREDPPDMRLEAAARFGERPAKLREDRRPGGAAFATFGFSKRLWPHQLVMRTSAWSGSKSTRPASASRSTFSSTRSARQPALFRYAASGRLVRRSRASVSASMCELISVLGE